MDAGEQAARDRIELLFRAVDRLTPGELARIGFRLAPGAERERLRRAVDDAAAQTGRGTLVNEARLAAREAVLRRYSSGSYQATFIGLNWGLSQGTVESRVAIAEALADAAAAAAVEDALDPEVAAALALDAAAITDLASGEASEGSLAQALRDSDDPELRPAPWSRVGRRVAAVVIVAVFAVAGGIAGVWVAVAGVVAGIRALTRNARRRGD